jgi:hypothetical protein
MRVRTLRLLFAASLAVQAALFAAPARADVAVSIGIFHDRLAPYGRWYQDPRFGEVWAPRVQRGWRPYTLGHWVYTSDYGWLWVESEPFGWATYHYGRWFFDPAAGWVWIPGVEWAPAWVSWRASDDYWGWAPLAPRGYEIGAPNWVFVDQRHFLAPRLESVVVVPSRNPAIFQRAAVVGSVSEDRGRWRNPGIDVHRIEGATGRRVEPFQVREARRPATRVDARRREVQVFRPGVQQQAQDQEKNRPAATARTQPERAQRQAAARPEPQRPTPQPVGRQQAGKEPPHAREEVQRQELQRLKKEQPERSQRAQRREPERAAVQPRPQPAPTHPQQQQSQPKRSQKPQQRAARQQPEAHAAGRPPQPQRAERPPSRAEAAGHPPQAAPPQQQHGGGGKHEGAKQAEEPVQAPPHP